MHPPSPPLMVEDTEEEMPECSAIRSPQQFMLPAILLCTINLAAAPPTFPFLTKLYFPLSHLRYNLLKV